jgi:hypothetical protein
MNKIIIKNNNKLILIIVLIIILIIILIIYNIYKHETFDSQNPTTTNSTVKTPLDRTKLYGSLFIDNLDEQINSMTDPDIKYEEKRNELNQYSDILL